MDLLEVTAGCHGAGAAWVCIPEFPQIQHQALCLPASSRWAHSLSSPMQDPVSQASVSSCGRTLRQDQVGQDCSLPRVSRCPPALAPFFFPFGLSLCHLSPCLLLPAARASWRQGQVWVQALLPQGVFSAGGRGCLQSLLPRGVQGVEVTGSGCSPSWCPYEGRTALLTRAHTHACAALWFPW